MNVRQRQPRERDEAYLAFLRKQPCEICGALGCDPAHIRSVSLEDGKDITGGGRKPSDRWALPLCRPHHDEQHRNNEVSWWASYGINPFKRSAELYAQFRAGKPKAEPRKRERKVAPRKPQGQRRKVPAGRPIPKRARNQWPEPGTRKINNRGRKEP